MTVSIVNLFPRFHLFSAREDLDWQNRLAALLKGR
jgi:hypothetical protein